MPLRKSLLVRLLIASALIAVCSVAATAWLAVETTTRALREEQVQVLADDMDVLARLSGYAATHGDWKGVERTVRALSAKTGRRIALTTVDRTLVADSAPRGTSLPQRASATVDPLRTDTYTERGAQRSGIDPRVVGPYRLTVRERAELDALARARRSCFARNGIETVINRTPSGRPTVDDVDTTIAAGYVPEECADGKLNTPTPTEETALTDLARRARACLKRQGLSGGAPMYIGVDVTDSSLGTRYVLTKFLKEGDSVGAREAQACADSARRAQLDPYVAPVAELFLGGGDSIAPRFDVSPANKAKVVGAAALVLAVTVAVTTLVATRLVRPLRALTAAAQQPPNSTCASRSRPGTRPASSPRRSTNSPSAANAWRSSAGPWSATSRTNCAARSPTSAAGWRSPATVSSTRTRPCSARCTRRPWCSSGSSTTCRTSPTPTRGHCGCTASPSAATNSWSRSPPPTGSRSTRRA